MAAMVVWICFMTACSEHKDSITDPDNSTDTLSYFPKEIDYEERVVSVIDPQGEAKGTVKLRFYSDMPNVAYVSISNFQSIMYPGTTVQVVKTGPGRFSLISPYGTAMVNTQKDTFESDDYEAFTNMMGLVQPDMPNIPYDALPIIRWKSMERQPQNVHVTLDYEKFGIDLRADDTGIFFPFATIADLYTDAYMHLAAFNGEVVMVAPKGGYSLLNGYPMEFITPILTETRKKDLAEFSYKNLSFTMTNFFGYPGRALLESDMKEKGMDQALKDYGQAGQMTRELLQSTNMYGYIAGTYTHGFLHDDGGHTYTDVTKISDLSGNPEFKSKVEAIKAEKKEEFYSYCPEYKDVEKVQQDRKDFANQLKEHRKEKMGDGVKYYKEGNTVYCWFDSFLCDDSGWRKFYRGEAPKPSIENYPDDWLVVLVDALEKAENDPEVKNFVLDISTNGGGSSDVVLFVSSLFSNKNDMFYENVLTGQRVKNTFEVDRNLDGMFDERDDEMTYHLNFALLVSSYSFSCGNMLPAMLKDYGIPLIGQQTGGGSCGVLFNPTAEGFGYRYSTHKSRLINTKGENIDKGIVPTYTLETPEDFYDIQKVTQLIESYYSAGSH